MCKDVTCLLSLTQDSNMLPARTPSSETHSSVTVVRILEKDFSLDPKTFVCFWKVFETQHIKFAGIRA